MEPDSKILPEVGLGHPDNPGLLTMNPLGFISLLET
jgi:hypothetical protein